MQKKLLNLFARPPHSHDLLAAWGQTEGRETQAGARVLGICTKQANAHYVYCRRGAAKKRGRGYFAVANRFIWLTPQIGPAGSRVSDLLLEWVNSDFS